MTADGGVPVIVGARFGGLLTAIANAASWALAWPSLTLIAMLLNVPTSALVGVPCRRPVLDVNVAQVGRLVMLNVNVWPLGSLAVGVNVYAVPTVAVVAGVPEMIGGTF